MKTERKSILKRASNLVLGSIIVVWIMTWCLTTRLGMFVWLTLLGWVSSTLMIGGAVNAIAWNFFDDHNTNMIDSGWFWTICLLGSMIWALDYMHTRELLKPPELPKPYEPEED